MLENRTAHKPENH